jgi:hypothetical protein
LLLRRRAFAGFALALQVSMDAGIFAAGADSGLMQRTPQQTAPPTMKAVKQNV